MQASVSTSATLGPPAAGGSPLVLPRRRRPSYPTSPTPGLQSSPGSPFMAAVAACTSGLPSAINSAHAVNAETTHNSGWGPAVTACSMPGRRSLRSQRPARPLGLYPGLASSGARVQRLAPARAGSSSVGTGDTPAPTSASPTSGHHHSRHLHHEDLQDANANAGETGAAACNQAAEGPLAARDAVGVVRAGVAGARDGSADGAVGEADEARVAQSEYVEEYETVYETETEPMAEAVVPAQQTAEGLEGAAPGAVGSSLAEVVAGGAALGSGAAQREQAPEVAAATAAPLQAGSLPLAYLSGYGSGRLGGTTVGGWALAAALLLAVRLSREAADAERTDLQALQARQAEGRQLDSELRARRKAFLEEERRRVEEEAAKRVAEAKTRQEEEARVTAERQRLYKEEEAREAQRMKEAQEAARRVYQEREARLAEELAARAEMERRLRETAEARRKEEAEARRRAEAEAAQRAAEARAAAAAADAAQRAAEAAARQEAERRLRLASTWYTLAFKGRVTGRPAAPGTTVPQPTTAAEAAVSVAALRGPPAARLQLHCAFRVSHAARTAPTLAAEWVAPALPPGGESAGPDTAAVAAVVAAAEADEAAAAATMTLPADELPEAAGRGGGGVAAAGADVDGCAAEGSSGRPYESAAAAVEGAVELAGAAAAPLAALLGSASPSAAPHASRSGWLGALPLQPGPREALRRALAGPPASAGDAGGGPAAPATSSLPPAVTESGSFEPQPPHLRSQQKQQQLPPHAEAVSELERVGAAGRAEEEALVDVELRHWARIAHLQLLASGRQVCGQLAPLLGPAEELSQEFECRLSRQVPPPLATLTAGAAAVVPPPLASSLSHAAAAVASGRLQHAVDLLNGVISREEAAAAAARDGAANGAALPPLAVAALVYGELMEAAGYVPPPPRLAPLPQAVAASAAAATVPDEAPSTMAGASGSRVPAEGGDVESDGLADALAALERLARYQLAERARGAPADSLTVTAQMLRPVLPGGPQHPICRILDRLAEANMSIGTRQQMQIRKQRATLEAQAAAVLEQQRAGASGGALVVGPGGAAEARGSLVPIPERLWATRNVANSLLRFGEALQVGEAVSMLEEAVSAARQHYGERHPCQLAVLLDLLDALAAAAANEAASGGAEGGAGGAAAAGQGQVQATVAARRIKAAGELLEIVQALSERYQAGRDNLSCVLLLEATGVELAPAARAAGPSGRAVARALSSAVDEAKELVYSLKPPEARMVMTARRDGDLPKVLRRLAREFTEELGAYTAGKRNRWVDAWNKGGPLPALRL